jgi:hypothetical protein
MNDQLVRQLAEQAGFKILTDGRIVPTLDHNGECGRDLEKFAELIIKQCAELTLDYKSETYYNGWLDYRDEIKKHFGVKQ